METGCIHQDVAGGVPLKPSVVPWVEDTLPRNVHSFDRLIAGAARRVAPCTGRRPGMTGTPRLERYAAAAADSRCCAITRCTNSSLRRATAPTTNG